VGDFFEDCARAILTLSRIPTSHCGRRTLRIARNRRNPRLPRARGGRARSREARRLRAPRRGGVESSRRATDAWRRPAICTRSQFLSTKEERLMPESKTIQRARTAQRQGKAPTTAAGEFVREEIEHVREGKHGARSPKQAIAIGLSKARRAGVPLAPPRKGQTSEATRRKAKQDVRKAKKPHRTSARRSQATKRALAREGRQAASPQALSEHAKEANGRRRRSGRGRSSARRRSD
jgi:hypothetical protein